uniref:General transcription and DNA repair factor IIH subunit TFB5 n=1 Tax=Romanomermis culicivorax TaxID=13658 RepID=A0A915I8Q3_ROMCU
MKQFLLHLDENLSLGVKFIIKDLDETHLFISQDSLATLQQKIDSLMDSLSPDFSEK